jgi:hypothetical protein
LHFRDARAVEQLEQWIVAEDDWLAPTAFTALAAIAPERLLSALDRVDVATPFLFRHQWLEELFLQRPKEMQRAIVQWLGSSPNLLYRSLDFFAGHEHELEAATVDYLLRALERAADELQKSATLEHCPNEFRWGLSSIARINTPNALSCFTSCVGGSLERKLTDIALRWRGNDPDAFDVGINDIETILLKIGGSGIARVINGQLALDASWSPLERGPVLVDSDTIKQLQRIADDNELAETRRGRKPVAQGYALLWLAHARRNVDVVHALLRWGRDVVRDGLADIRKDAGPLTHEEVQPAAEAFANESGTARRHAVWVFGLSGRREYIPLVREFLAGQPVGSEAAIDAMLALTQLPDDSDESAFILEKHLLCSKWDYARHALNALSASDTPTAEDILERVFLRDVSGIHNYRWMIAARLCRNPERRKRLLPHIWEKMKRGHDFWGSSESECYDLLTELAASEVREFLWRKATPTHTSYDSPDARAAAIAALVKVDREAAFAAAEAELSASHSVDTIPEILLRVDAARAIPRLCKEAAAQKDTAKRWQIARALRLVSKDEEVSRVLEIQMESDAAQERSAACELCGWMGLRFLEDKLRTAALDDLNREVRRAARNSLRRQAQESVAYALADKLPTAPVVTQWSLVFEIIDLVDPHLLLRLETPVSFQRLMSKLPAAMILRVNARLQERMRRLEHDARDQDRR